MKKDYEMLERIQATLTPDEIFNLTKMLYRELDPRVGRRTGRTTRIIDLAVQELFMKGEATLRDHHEGMSLDHIKHGLRDRLRPLFGRNPEFKISEVDGRTIKVELLRVK